MNACQWMRWVSNMRYLVQVCMIGSLPTFVKSIHRPAACVRPERSRWLHVRARFFLGYSFGHVRS